MTTLRWGRAARCIVRVLNDAVLGFFALASLFLMVVPSVFSFSPSGMNVLLAAEFGIIALFALEYVAALTLAPDKGRFLRNRWRILDLLIIVVPSFALLPAGPDVLRSSPVLRLLRLGRLALLGTRSGLALTTAAKASDSMSTDAPSELEVFALHTSGKAFEAIP